MRGLIRTGCMNPWAVTVFALTIVVLGTLSLFRDPDRRPARLRDARGPGVDLLRQVPPSEVQSGDHPPDGTLDRHGPGDRPPGSPLHPGGEHRPQLFPPGGPSTAGRSPRACRWPRPGIPNLPPGSLPPIVMAFDPGTTTPVCLVALNSRSADEATLYDVGRYQVRYQGRGCPGAIDRRLRRQDGAVREIYLDQGQDAGPPRRPARRDERRGRVERLPADRRGDRRRHGLLPQQQRHVRGIEDMVSIPLRTEHGNRAFVRGDMARPEDAALIQTTIVRVEGRRSRRTSRS